MSAKPPSCQTCPYYTRPGPISGDGPTPAKIMYIGEAPGAQEAALGKPFVGPSGKILRGSAKRAGTIKADVFITNLVKCHPPKNENPRIEAVQACSKFLQQELNLVKPHSVVLIGALPTSALLRKTPITKWRGSVFNDADILGYTCRAIPCLHPAGLLHKGQMKLLPLIVADLRKANEPVRSQDFVWSDTTAPPNATQRECAAIDIETTYDKTHSEMFRVGFGFLGGDTISYNTSYSKHIQDQLNSIDVGVYQNGAFDIRILQREGYKVPKGIFDTMLAHHTINSELPHGLDSISSEYLHIQQWKHLSQKEPAFYNCMDCHTTMMLKAPLEAKLKEYGMESIAQNAFDIIPHVVAMQVHGVKRDQKLAMKLYVGALKRVERLETQVKPYITNWRSSKQLIEVLLKLGITPPKKRRKKSSGENYSSYTVEAEVLESLAESHDSPFLKIIVTMRKLEKLASTYFNPNIGDFAHSEFLLRGTSTGRLSSREPNLQNVPKGISRSIYVPTHEGWEFASADYKQIEMYMSAWDAKEQNILDAFAAGFDIHKFIAAEIYNKRVEDIIDVERQSAKFIVYGLNYGRGAASIAKAYGMSLSATKAFVDRYFGRFAKLAQRRKEYVDHAEQHNYVATYFGRRRWFFDRKPTEIYAFVPQATAAEYIRINGLLRLPRELPKPARLAITVHDDVVVEYPKEMRKEVTECLKDVMESPLIPNLKIPISISYGPNWGNLS